MRELIWMFRLRGGPKNVTFGEIALYFFAAHHCRAVAGLEARPRRVVVEPMRYPPMWFWFAIGSAAVLFLQLKGTGLL